MDRSNDFLRYTRDRKRQLSEPSSPSYYVATSPSNRLYDNHRKRQHTSIQHTSRQTTSRQHSPEKLLSPTETPLYKRLRKEKVPPSKPSTAGGRCQHDHQERKRQATSHYLLPTASSLQRRIVQASSKTPDHNRTPSRSSSPLQTYEVTAKVTPGRDHHDRLAERQASVTLLEQDHKAADRQQRMEDGSVLKMYGRYLQWEWMALKMEKTMKDRGRLIREQIQVVNKALEGLNQHGEGDLSTQQGGDEIRYWMKTYLEDVEKILVLLEDQQLDSETAEDSCVSKLTIAKAQLNRLMDRGLTYQTYKENMDMIDESIACLKSISVHSDSTTMTDVEDTVGL
ncbi:hypothetical protein [Absidia glauca]|uniref:Uncharacterized protein n=1 Tax=Absidia glauca TaxID=4829 RepID=A0A163J5P3_ABSGL|nr:hypothetical protein [Absidia glauca]